MDGWITIGTKMDTKQLEKDLKEAEKELQQFQKEKEKLLQEQSKEQQTLAGLQEEKQAYEKLGDQYEEARAKLMELKAQKESMKGNIHTEEEANQYSALIREINETRKAQNDLSVEIAKGSDGYFKAVDGLSAQEAKVNQINAQVENNANEENVVKQKIEEINKELSKRQGLENIKSGLTTISSQTDKIITKIGKWALAVFSVRSAYNLVRKASSTLQTYDKQYASNISYVSYALAQMLAPVLNYIVKLAYTLLTYINYIVHAFTGINLFANASAKSFKSASDSLSKSSKSAKEVKNSLAGFDEMNTLTDTSSSSSGSSGVSMPSYDLSSLNGEVPAWLQWIVDNKDLILAILAGIGAGLVAMKISDFAKALGLVKNGLTGIQALGIGVIVAGIVLLVQDVVKLIQDPSWENFGKVLTDIGIIIGGIMLVMGNWWGLLVALVALAVRLVIDNWDTIKGVLDTIGGWINDHIITPVVSFFTGLWETIKTGATDLWNKIVEIATAVFNAVVSILSPFIAIVASILSTIWANIQIVVSNIKQIVTLLFNVIKTILTPIINFIGNILSSIWNAISSVFSKIKSAVTALFNTIKSIFTPLISFFSNLWSSIKSVFTKFATMIGDAISGVIKSAINGLLGLVEGVLNAPINAINALTDVINAVPGINLGKLQTFNLPRLASGAIINQPGRGAYIGGAYAGEAGREGIIPLTDSQAMETLGEAIGRYITINASITNSMNGRVLSRQLQKITNNNAFAYNG